MGISWNNARPDILCSVSVRPSVPVTDTVRVMGKLSDLGQNTIITRPIFTMVVSAPDSGIFRLLILTAP